VVGSTGRSSYKDRPCLSHDPILQRQQDVEEELTWGGDKVVRHAKYVMSQMAEVAVPRALFAATLKRIQWFGASAQRRKTPYLFLGADMVTRRYGVIPITIAPAILQIRPDST